MTLIEICVYAVLSLLMIAVVTGYFFQTQKLFHRTSHTSEMLSSKIDAFTFITRDLSSAKRVTLGSILLNGDFETAQNAGQAANWANASSANGVMGYLQNWSDTSHNGIHSVSLSRTGGAEATYDSDIFTLTPGNAYMITAWVRTSDAGTGAIVRLADNASFDLGSDISNSTAWFQIKFRYPAANVYQNNVLNLNQAKIQLGANAGTSIVYFDDIAVTPIQSVLASETAAEINVSRTVLNVNSPTDTAGFHFVRWENQQPVQFRYRVEGVNEENLVVRERFDTTTNQWAVTNRFARGVAVFRIDYDSIGAVPNDGKDVPFNVSFRMKDSYMRGQQINTKLESMMVFPAS